MTLDSSAEPLFPLNRNDSNVRAIVDAIADAVVIVNQKGQVRFINPAAERMFDREIGEFFGRPFGFPVVAGQAAELDIPRRDGTVVTAEMRTAAITWENQPACLATLRDITERKRAEAERERLNALLERRVTERTCELQAANAELAAFTAAASHDLRGPLQGIIGFTDLLLEDCQSILGESQMDQLRIVSNAAWRMTELIEQLMRLAHVTALELARENVRLDRMAEDIVAQLRAEEPGRRVQFSVKTDMVVYGDPRLIRIALENLLGNAWKYTSQQETAQIAFGARREADGRDLFYVHDNGVGFAMSKASQLFTPFKRLHSASEFAGSGIGLATVQRIVLRHGGYIRAEGEINEGATFYFTLVPEGS